MFLAKLFGGLEDMPELKGIQSVEIMTVSNECSDNRQKEIKKQIASLSDDAEYTTLISIKGEEDKVRLMARQENDMIKELLFVVLEKEDDSVVIRIKGKMNLSDVQSMIEKGEISKN